MDQLSFFFFSFFFLNTCFFQFSVRAHSVSSSHAEAGIATGPQPYVCIGA